MFAFYYIEDLPELFAFTVNANIEISGKSIQELYRTISLLKLFSEIRTMPLQVRSKFYPQGCAVINRMD